MSAFQNSMLVALACAYLGSLGSIAAPLDFWTNRFTVTNFAMQAGTFGAGRFVASGASVTSATGGLFTSKDGASWTKTSEDNAHAVAFGNGLFVATGPQWLHTSSNGDEWISRLAPGHELYGSVSPVEFGLGRFWINRNLDSGRGRIRYSSADGLAWRLESTNSPVVWAQFHGGRFFALGQTPPLQSFDGVDFVPADGWPSIRSIAFMNGTWAVVEPAPASGNPQTGSLLVSTNGRDWTRLLVSQVNPERQRVKAVGERFVLVVGASYFFESTDGFTWTSHRVVGDPYVVVDDLAYGADTLIALYNRREDRKPTLARLYQSRPLTPPVPVALSASMLPAIVLREGVPGAGFAIESSETPSGPWKFETRVFPDSYPFSFLAPGPAVNHRFFRAMAE